MENQEKSKLVTKYIPFLKFKGEGFELLKITIVNTFLTIITFGIYYPWAKVNYLNYYYSNTEFKDSPFKFTGTGKQIFRGYIRVFLIVALVMICYFLLQTYGYFSGAAILLLGFYLLVILFMPFAINGFLRFRASKSYWRGIRFGYRGNGKEFFNLFMKNVLFLFLTFGLYFSWFLVNIRKYIYGHARFGNLEFRYTGEGGDLFYINFKGIILTYLTIGIYSFWYQKELFTYHLKNTQIIQEGKTIRLSTQVKGMDFLELGLVNIVLLIFTLGLAFPWVLVRTRKFFYQHTWIQEDFDANTIVQTEANYSDTTGEGFVDEFDVDLGFFDF